MNEKEFGALNYLTSSKEKDTASLPLIFFSTKENAVSLSRSKLYSDQ